MARYYVFDVEADAIACIEKIDARAATVFSTLGRLDAGGWTGKNRHTGLADASAQKTTTWTTARLTEQGKWVVMHPEKWVGDDIKIGARVWALKDFLASDATGWIVADADASWWPKETFHAVLDTITG